MDNLLSIIKGLRSLNMANIKSKGYSLVLCGKKINIIRTPEKWIIAILSNNHIDYVYQFIFDVHDTIRVLNGSMYMNIEKFISSIMEAIHK